MDAWEIPQSSRSDLDGNFHMDALLTRCKHGTEILAHAARPVIDKPADLQRLNGRVATLNAQRRRYAALRNRDGTQSRSE